ncbi:hypothetical protein MRB53_040927 [Persea americana]|nr:hypothetical protein MRB53_040927 [Persea americana]
MEAKIRSSKHRSQPCHFATRPGISCKLFRWPFLRYWRKLRGTRCVATGSGVNLLSLPFEILYQILLELFNHNKEWDTDLAFFQASKVNTRLRKIALDMVEREALDPLRHFLFTRIEWLEFMRRSSLLNGNVDDQFSSCEVAPLLFR